MAFNRKFPKPVGEGASGAFLKHELQAPYIFDEITAEQNAMRLCYVIKNLSYITLNFEAIRLLLFDYFQLNINAIVR